MNLTFVSLLKSFASKKYTVGLNGFVDFEMFSEPHVAAGDSIQIDAYEPGEKILERGGGDHSCRAAALDNCPDSESGAGYRAGTDRNAKAEKAFSTLPAILFPDRV